MTMPSRQSDFAPSPAVESVHQDDSYVARDGYRSPYVLDEEYAEHDLMLLDRRREHAPAECDWAYADVAHPQWGRPRDRFWAAVKKDPKPDGCWEWQRHRKRGGYGCISWRGSMQVAHRVAWELDVGPIPDGLQVLHKCDNPGCVRPDHLFLGTQADNVADMDAKGRRVSIPGNKKLTSCQVRQIRKRYASGEFQAELAKEFGISPSGIRRIVNKEIWRDVQDTCEAGCPDCESADWLSRDGAPDLPPGRMANGCWKCIGCGRIVGKRGRWLNWCSECGYDLWEG